MKETRKLSPAAFALLQDKLIELESKGYSCDYAASAALNLVGLLPAPGTQLTLIVDNNLLLNHD
jgi:hypothetical protein